MKYKPDPLVQEILSGKNKIVKPTPEMRAQNFSDNIITNLLADLTKNKLKIAGKLNTCINSLEGEIYKLLLINERKKER